MPNPPSILRTFGALDQSQLPRLLRSPKSTLLFATFDPRPDCAAINNSNGHVLPVDEQSYHGRRIVVETLPTGESFWKFVPGARLNDGAKGEGRWPRVIEICG
jgi:hypothetical protein